MTGEKFLTTEELSEILKIPARTLRFWRKENRGPPWLKMGRSVKYRESEVSEWVNKQRRDGDAQ